MGRLLRLLRIRRGWRLVDLAGRTGISISSLARHERGGIDSLRRLERYGRALDIRFELRPVGRGTDLSRTLDTEHAAIVNLLAQSLLAARARVEIEVSFSEWGERGRIDLLAAVQGRLLVTEAKTDIADLQDLFGLLDVKLRLAPVIGHRLGMAGTVVALLAVASTPRNRAVVTAHPALFASFAVRNFAGSVPLSGDRVLLWVPARAAHRSGWLAGRQRVRSS